MKKIKILYKYPGCEPFIIRMTVPAPEELNEYVEIPLRDGVYAIVNKCDKDTNLTDLTAPAVILGKKDDRYVSLSPRAIRSLRRAGIIGG